MIMFLVTQEIESEEINESYELYKLIGLACFPDDG